MANFDLNGQVALVTGASSGLGRRFAAVLARQGATVVACARRKDRLDDLVAEIAAGGDTAHAIAMDVSDPESVTGGLDAAIGLVGTPTILVNNAGVASDSLALDMSDEVWRQTMSVNVDGVFRVAREASIRMQAAATGGSIINIASIMGVRVAKGLTSYCTSKAAVIQLTKGLAVEWAKYGIRVNAIAPGFFESEMTERHLSSSRGQEMAAGIPIGRHGLEGELDGALLLLASSAGSYMTGSVITVDGGHALEVST